MRGRRRALPGVALVAAAAAVSAGEPLYVKNLSPVTGLIGLPSQRSAETPGAGRLNVALHSSLANTYVNEFKRPEAVNLDGEVLRFALELRYGLGDDWDIQLELPWLQHSGGQLDSLIDGWHDIFGMSDGGRDLVPRDLLDYRYLGPKTGFLLEDETSGIGDITLALSHVFYRRRETAVALALGYKFGSGEEDDLLGSGAHDGFLALRFTGAHGSELPLTWHGQLGYLRAGQSDLLRGIQSRDLWFAGLALDWALWDRVSLLAQLDGHAGPTHSDLTGLGADAWMGSLGLRWRMGGRWNLDLNFVEDLQVETAPDITFQASLSYRPQ